MEYQLNCRECGNIRVVYSKPTKQSMARLCKDCGYKARKVHKDGHGETGTRLFTIWNSAKKRTNGSMNKVAFRYTEKGIKMCKEWRDDYKVFALWARQNGYKDELTLDRIDNDGDYEPNNCRWTTKSIQAQNTAKLRKNNTSGYRGVVFERNSNIHPFVAVIHHDDSSHRIGLYKTAKEAAIAYDEYVIENNLEHTRNFA